ncbi:hypothetical protein K432DRAFT_424178 [Lepidopterella palustris CBS 459.81]|uniref:Ribosome biogenesis protein Urb1 n=1 Tax=Lepidopterella palustris CBS 459.81 TaxID=1314670 RepID=A0A8E2EEE2_9PEZI|nr:hypothetical protein K432DRAFT_424178 [Lepidopterella palustris CBS 459.81]
MSKRTAAEADQKHDKQNRHSKRQRIEELSANKLTPLASNQGEVSSGRQLQRLLIFEQGTTAELRSGIQTFKTFLDSILYPPDESDAPRKRAILREYLDLQKQKWHADEDTIFLPNLMQAWAYAAETNYEQLLSAVTAVLALLLKVLSRDLDFREYGISLGKTVLQYSQAKHFSSSLSAPNNKEFIISPSLRLLTEVVSFDGGVLAKQVYSKRDFVLDARTLARNLSLWKDQSDRKFETARKPSIRTNAVRYLLHHLKYQDEGAKIDILKQGNVVRALFEHIWTDPPALAVEILDIVKKHVFLDKSIPRKSKARVLTERNLASIASLYKNQSADESLPEQQKLPSVAAHEFLLFVCTSPEMGIMLPCSGWYPPGTEKDGNQEVNSERDHGIIDVGLDSIGRYDRKVPVRNTILAEFAQTLRPYGSIMEQELLLAILKSSPELVADYFFRKASFAFDPKLTATWIGYSAFLFSAVQLPIPLFLGRQSAYGDSPPPTSIVIESILPQPLSQKVLTRCLNQNSDLVTFFAVRILTVAFQKLQKVLAEFKRALVEKSPLWEQASKRLITEFQLRCPQMSTIITAFRNTSSGNLMQREAVTRLLTLYYKVIPQAALNEKFDVSLPLATALAFTENSEELSEDRELRLFELENLVQIARYSPNMRWWQKPESLPHSPFITLLKLMITITRESSYVGIRDLLLSVVRDHGIFQQETTPSSVDALIASLRNTNQPVSDEVFEFLDDCCGRFVKRPIKYQDDLDEMLVANLEEPLNRTGPFSLIWMTLIEQWAYKASVESKATSAAPLAIWLSRLLFLLKKVGEDETLLLRVSEALVQTSSKTHHAVLKNALRPQGKEWAEELLQINPGKDSADNEVEGADKSPTAEQSELNILAVDLEIPPVEDENHPGLNRWRQKEIEESIEHGDIGGLLLCLCSRHVEIRLQAVTNLRQLIVKVESAKNPELDQLALLLGEVVETCRMMIDTTPLPYVAGVFAARAVTILADPTHEVFPKLNKFLNKGPVWDVEKIPPYMAENIIRKEPYEDDGYHREVDWLLDYLIDCLRTAEDMEIFRAKSIFERILGFYASPSCWFKMKEKILRLLFRAAAVGGSTTLITRSGLLSWIQAQIAVKDGHETMLKKLASRLYQTCDQAKVGEWSNGGVKHVLDGICGNPVGNVQY